MKWYSGGKERGDEAIKIIEELLVELKSNVDNEPLENILLSYKNEIMSKSYSIPLLFNRMNLE
ncbi:bacteriocin immunity protein, partial [Liquorilactobacillus ghanensis]